MTKDSQATRIFILEDDPIFTRLLQHQLEMEGRYELHFFSNGQDFLNNLSMEPDVVSIDCNLPDIQGLDVMKQVKEHNDDIACIIVSAQENVEVVVQAYRSGADDYIVKNKSTSVELMNSIRNFDKQVQLRKEVQNLRGRIVDRDRYSKMIGDSKPILSVMNMLQRVENTNMMVLITGESGTGKEVVANILHNNSSRRRQPFVAVNMGAIPADIAESELFGHEKGAFTGADSRRIGKFEEAQGGSIFLDEIGEMDLQLQIRLLRVLQEGTLVRVGSNKEIKLDVRVIAATNRDLGQMVREGKFREDLFYRLQGFLIHMPPLRERGNDILLLARHFLDEFCQVNRLGTKTFSSLAEKAMMEYAWPGNVRELKSMVQRAAVMSDGNEIQKEDLIFSSTSHHR